MLEYTPEIMAFLKEPKPLIVAKANVRSLVHRRVHLDYIGVKRFDAAGRLIGEFRIVGLFTSTAYTRPARSIPYLRRKLAAVEQRAGFDPNSHSGKALANVIEQYPRDELFQIDEDTLCKFARRSLQLDEHPRVRVLARRDRFDRFVSVLVFVPRERFDSQVRGAIGDYLAKAFAGQFRRSTRFFRKGRWCASTSSSAAAAGRRRKFRAPSWKKRSPTSSAPGRDAFAESLGPHLRSRQGAAISRAIWRSVFRRLSRGLCPGRCGRGRQARSKDCQPSARSASISIARRQTNTASVRLKVWSLDRPLPLSERVPVLENMGFRVVDERTFEVAPEGAATVWFHDMLLRRADGAADRSGRGAQGALEASVPDGDARRRRERRLQRAGR